VSIAYELGKQVGKGKIFLAVVGVVVLAGFVHLNRSYRGQPETEQTLPASAPARKTPEQLLQLGHSLYESGNTAEALTGLNELPSDYSNKPEVRAFIKKVAADNLVKIKRADQEKVTALIVLRREFADTYQRELLRENIDADVSTRGNGAETLVIKYVLINRPFVYNFQNGEPYEVLKRLQFKKAILTDGYEKTWTVTID